MAGLGDRTRRKIVTRLQKERCFKLLTVLYKIHIQLKEVPVARRVRVLPVSTVPDRRSVYDWELVRYCIGWTSRYPIPIGKLFLVISNRNTKVSCLQTTYRHKCERSSEFGGTIRPNVSSPFSMDGALVSSKDAQTSSAGMMPW